MHVDTCLVFDGVHYGGPDCPHQDPSDELGEVHPSGWTVQQNTASLSTTFSPENATLVPETDQGGTHDRQEVDGQEHR